MKAKYLFKPKAVAAAIAFAFISVGIFSCQKENPESYTEIHHEIRMVTYNYELIPNQYIVVLDEERNNFPNIRRSVNANQFRQRVKIVAEELVAEYKPSTGLASVEFIYNNTIIGFSVKLDATALSDLRKDPRVSLIEPDMKIVLDISNKGKGNKPGGGNNNTSPPPQTTPYGISRVKGKAYAGDKKVFILDTGIQLDHEDLNVDESLGFNAFTKGKEGRSLTDQNGHGTHVAGTVAAKDNSIGVIGVAAGAKVVPVKVLDSRGSGTLSGVIAGVDHVASVGLAGDVANMSLTGGASSTLDNAVISAASKGIKFALAAGNNSSNANNYSPARANHANIFTVSAMDIHDNWASFSNWGNPPIDHCSPGVKVLSTWINNSYHTISGTSMAAPHVAGILLHNSFTTNGTVNNDPDGNPDSILIVK